MQATCSECKETYEEKDQDNYVFIESDCPMLCYECKRKLDDDMMKELQSRLRL